MKNLSYSNPFLRFLGYLIDLLIGLTIISILLFYVSSSYSLPLFLNKTLLLLIILIYFGLVSPFIEVLLNVYFGGSIGKLLVGIKVVNEKGSYLSPKKALVRTFLGNAVASVFLFAGFLWILVDKNRQGWHDMAAGSFVVTKNRFWLITGIFAILALIIINIGLLSNTFRNFALNSQIYADAFADIKQEFKLPESPTLYLTPTPGIYLY